MHINLPYTISGRVVKGSQQATRLGYPTANLDITSGESLSHGVYSGIATCEKIFSESPCLIFYGTPYSLDKNGAVRFEIHVLNSSLPDLYGKQLTATLLEFLRPNKKFEDMDQLAYAIQQDITTCHLKSII